MRRLRMKWLNVCLVFTVMLATLGMQPLNAAQAAAAKGSFPDVPSNHWSVKHVSKMAHKNVIQGNTDGTFAPSANVTKEQAITMAIRLMGLEEEAKASKVSVIAFEVGEFYKPYVSYAFNIGLLNYQEEVNALGPAGSNEKWGSGFASREWIAKLTIRAIDHSEAATGTEMFADQQDIAAWALGYVNAAVNLQIVNGKNGQFYPKDYVTRAELAAFFSRADIYMEEQPSFVVLGSVRSINSSSITIQNEIGQLVQYELDSNTSLFTYAQDSPITYTSIENYNNVYLIHREGKAEYIEVIDDHIRSNIVQGKLAAPSSGDKIIIEVNGERFSYELNRTSLEIIGMDGGGKTLGSLVVNSTIELTYIVEEQYDPIVTQIKVIREPVNKTAQGAIAQLHSLNSEIVIKESVSGNEERYVISSDLTGAAAKIAYGNRFVTLADLANGDKIAYKVENDIVVSIELLEPLNPLLIKVEGTVTNNDIRARVLYFDAAGDLLGKYYASKVEIELEGNLFATEKDIVPGDQVILYLDQKEQIVKITIRNRSIATKFMVPMHQYITETQSLLTIENGKPVIYEVDEDTVFKYWNDTVIAHDKVASTIQKNQRVDIVYSTVTNKLISVKVSSEYNGKISALDATNRKLTLDTDQGQRITFDIPTTVFLEIPNRNTAGLSDFKVGDEVRIGLNNNQTSMGTLQLKHKELYKVTEINYATNRLTMTNDAGDKVEAYVPFQTPIKSSSNATTDFRSIVVGHDIFVTFVGRNVTQISIASVSYGKVTAVDPASKLVTIIDYNSNNAIKRFSYDPATGIRLDDRVYVVSDAEGGYSLHLMSNQERTFWKLDTNTRSIFFYKTSSTDNNHLELHANMVVTDGGKTIQLSSLKDRDKVQVYMYNNKIIEIEKK